MKTMKYPVLLIAFLLASQIVSRMTIHFLILLRLPVYQIVMKHDNTAAQCLIVLSKTPVGWQQEDCGMRGELFPATWEAEAIPRGTARPFFSVRA